MNARHIAPSLLMAGLIGIAAPAMASDELAGALFGAGAGAVLGHMAGGNDGAVAGGIFGAIIGAAVADDGHRRVVARPHPHPHPHAHYGPMPVRYSAPPRHWSVPHYGHPQWRHDRDGFRDGPRERNRWREVRRGDDRHGWQDDRGRHSDGPRNYRNW